MGVAVVALHFDIFEPCCVQPDRHGDARSSVVSGRPRERPSELAACFVASFVFCHLQKVESHLSPRASPARARLRARC